MPGIPSPPLCIMTSRKMAVPPPTEDPTGFFVLSQIQADGANKPIAYLKKKITPCESRYSATDKEALGVVFTCRKFHHHLWRASFTVIIDHQPLTSVFKRKTKSPRMNRWNLEMREYNYDIHYQKGKDNYVADHLSRPVRLIVRPPENS